MPDLKNLRTGETQHVPEHKVAKALASVDEQGNPLYAPIDASQKATVIDERTGEAVSVSAGDLDVHLGLGDRSETGDDFREREDSARKEREHGGIGSKIANVVEGGINSATLGLYDAAGGLVHGDDFRTRRKESKEVNAGYDFAGEALGYLAPSVLLKSAGTAGRIARATPVGAAERLGAKIGATGASSGLAGRAAAKGAGFAVEGGIVGAGETLSDYALATTELERERAAASLGSNVLFGAAVGGGIGAGSELVATGVRRAKKLADDLGERMAKRAEVSSEVAALDKEGLLALKRERGAAIGREAVEDAKAILDDQTAWRALSDDDASILQKARRKLRDDITNNAKLTSERPSNLLRPLYQEEEVLRKAIANSDTLLKEAAERESRLIKTLDDHISDFKKPVRFRKQEGAIFGSVFDRKVNKKGVLLDKPSLEAFRDRLSNGAYRRVQAEGLEGLPEILDANMAIQAKVKSVVEKTAPGMVEIESALDALKGGGKKGIVEKTAENAVYGGAVGALSAVMPFPAAAMVASRVSERITDLVLGRMGKGAAKAAKSTKAVVDQFVDVGAKTLQKTPPLATKVLAGVRYADETPPISAALPKATLVREYKAREAEIYSQVTRGPGGITMRPQARMKLAERLSGVRAASPELADSLETIANRKIAFLAEKLPKRPDFMEHSVGPDSWHPGNSEIRAFARYMAAAENPAGVEERLADGTITPQDVEAYRTVYPERYNALRNDIAARLPELQETLPMAKRMALSIFTGLHVEPSLEPSIFERIQAQFSDEPGTQGGTQAPQAQPNFGAFGSVRSQEKTRSQKRME